MERLIFQSKRYDYCLLMIAEFFRIFNNSLARLFHPLAWISNQRKSFNVPWSFSEKGKKIKFLTPTSTGTAMIEKNEILFDSTQKRKASCFGFNILSEEWNISWQLCSWEKTVEAAGNVENFSVRYAASVSNFFSTASACSAAPGRERKKTCFGVRLNGSRQKGHDLVSCLNRWE